MTLTHFGAFDWITASRSRNLNERHFPGYQQEIADFDKRPNPTNRRQKILRCSRDQVVTMLTQSRGASTETFRRHPASRGPSAVTPRHAASRGPCVETTHRRRPSRGTSTVTPWRRAIPLQKHPTVTRRRSFPLQKNVAAVTRHRAVTL